MIHRILIACEFSGIARLIDGGLHGLALGEQHPTR